MKLGIKICLFLFSATLLVAFAAPEKKIDKLVSKVWKDQSYTITDVQLPDSLKKDITKFCEIKIDGATEGYACYTTAFGCRIGGCAAPTNPNVQSYETFDYIVIYDTDMRIKRVDIANYSGDYGYQICNHRWLKQFIGETFGFKLGENVDGISGATVSAQFLIDDLNAVGKDLSTFLSISANL
jgi:hypothetical protein